MAQTYTLTVNIEKGGTITHETNEEVIKAFRPRNKK